MLPEWNRALFLVILDSSVRVLLVVAGLRAYFVEMPQRFPPDLGNALFWEAQGLPRGSGHRPL